MEFSLVIVMQRLHGYGWEIYVDNHGHSATRAAYHLPLVL